MKMTIFYVIPMLLLAVSAHAFSGKKQEILAASKSVLPDDPSVNFSSWCQNRFGHLTPDQSQCLTQLNYRFGKKSRREVWSTAVRVASMDTVLISSDGAPKALVGVNENEVHNGGFISQHDGMLAFSAEKPFSVSQVVVKRCFDAHGKTVRCNEDQSAAEQESKDGKKVKSEPRFPATNVSSL